MIRKFRPFSWRLSIVLTGAFAFGPTHANPTPIAEVLCAPTAKMHEKLTHHMGSQLAWQGLRSPDQIMELWVDTSGDWTLVVAYSSGKVCIVAMGTELTGFLADMVFEPPV